MQYNTFRQAEGIPMATTFLTNHIRQMGVWLTKAVVHKQDGAWKVFSRHFRMVSFFFLGGFILTLFCDMLKEREHQRNKELMILNAQIQRGNAMMFANINKSNQAMNEKGQENNSSINRKSIKIKE